MPHPSRSSSSIRTVSEFLGALSGFLGSPMDLDECRGRITGQQRVRDRALLRLFRDAVYTQPASPYARLLAHAGIAYPDVEGLLRTDGVEGALARLYQAGVHVTLDEFKGRRSIRRGSLDIPVSATDFDNTMLAPHFEVRTGGSRGPGRSLLVDLDLLTHEASYELCAAAQFGLLGRPRALWRPVPPGSAGIKALLKYAKVNLPVERWFSQSPMLSIREWRHTLFTTGTMMTARFAGRPLAWPEHVPIGRAETLARWLARCRDRRQAGILNTNAASAVRVCHAAETHGLDISGSFFRVGGEPFTAGKAAVVARAGCVAVSNYSMSEVGRIASACAHPDGLDDVHVALDKVALMTHDVVPPGGVSSVPGLHLTTLHPSTPKIMINVELGDYGTLSTRSCGCLWDDMGQTLHLRDIRSHEKLTAEGMHFVGSDLIRLVEQTLPEQFGGRAMDYQMVEDEHDGVPEVTLVVSPSVGTVDEERLAAVVIERLGGADAAGRMMASRWREAGTLRVLRREPYATPAGKVHALHVPYSEGRRRDA